MRYTTLGHKGLEVGVVGLGCMGMTYRYDTAKSRDDATSISVIHQAIELGITLMDTADVYGPYTNEELVGAALTGGKRERVVLATKVGLVDTGPKEGSTNSTEIVASGRPEHIRKSIDESLRRLRTDYLDLYQLHRVDSQVPLEESWGALAELVFAGKVRYLGLSEVSIEEIKRAQIIHPVTSVQSELSLWTRDPLAKVLPYCEEEGIAFLPYAPLGRGFLTGRISSFDDLPQDDVRRTMPRFQQDAISANLAIVEKVRNIAVHAGSSPAQVALAWVLAQGQYVIPIPGTKTPKYLMENAAAADLKLSEEDLADLDRLPTPLGNRGGTAPRRNP